MAISSWKAPTADCVDAAVLHQKHVQVYDGSKAHWSERDLCHPVNAYGRTKLEAEELIQVFVSLSAHCCLPLLLHLAIHLRLPEYRNV